MNKCYCIIQIIFTIVGTIWLFAFMFFNNVNPKDLLSDGFATYILFKNIISIGLLSLYIVAATLLSIGILYVFSKIFDYKSISHSIIQRFFYFQSIYYIALIIFLNISLIHTLINLTP